MAECKGIRLGVYLEIPEETLEKCLRILELWMTDHPNKVIEAHKAEDGKISLRIEDAPWIRAATEGENDH